MKIAIATDHNGVNEKKAIIAQLSEYEFIDLSTDNTPIDDYPDFAFRVCKSLINKEADLGILMCGTGIGMSIAANKIHNIIAAKVNTPREAFLARSHNQANVMTLAEYTENLEEILDNFINTKPSDEERHKRRLDKIRNLK